MGSGVPVSDSLIGPLSPAPPPSLHIYSPDPSVPGFCPAELLMGCGLLGPLGALSPRCCLQINMTHYIRHLSFGEDYPGIVNPLDRTNVTALQGTSLEGNPSSQSSARHSCPELSSPCSLHDVPVLCEGGTHGIHEARWAGKSAGAPTAEALSVSSTGVPSAWEVKYCSYSHMVGDKPRLRECR